MFYSPVVGAKYRLVGDLHRLIQVGVLTHDHRALASQLQGHRFDALRGLLQGAGGAEHSPQSSLS